MNSLEYLEKQIKNLENKINELENKGNNKYKRQRYNDYWFLDNDGNSISFVDKNDEVDNFCYSIGNYFEIKEQAENYKEKLLIEQELKDIAMELNKGEEIDWNNKEQAKYLLCFDYFYNKIDYDYEVNSKSQGVIHCLDSSFKDVAIERIGEERLTKYLKGELD